MSEQLSPFRIKRGRRVFDSYSAINSFSFALVTGNTVTLYALALGASSTVVGLLSAFMYLSYFAIPIGKAALRRGTLVKAFADNWMYRNWALCPLLAIPLLAARGFAAVALCSLVLCVFLFNLFRGIGLIANNPVIGSLAPGRDRGEYIVRLSLINNSTALLATVLLAFSLRRSSGLGTYNLAILVGIVTGIVASSLLYKLPDIGRGEDDPAKGADPGARANVAAQTTAATQTGPAAAGRGTLFADLSGLAGRFAEAGRDPNFRRFVGSYLAIGLGIGMARPFIAVFCKAVYGQSDSMVTVFTVCSSLGALFMGAVMRLTIDRLGAKPMYVIFAAMSLVSLVPALIAPGIASGVFAIVFLCALSALTNMGFAGQESAAQTYFFAMVPKDAILDLSMVYYFIIGGTGAVGSIAGGAFLDLLSGFGFSPLACFRVFFAVALLAIACGIRIQKGLLDLGSYPVRETLAVLFSPRDMRALTLLRRLDANEDPDEETEIIAELGAVASPVSAESLLDRLASPRFAVRYEALQSVASLERLSGKVRDALITELKEGEYSTAALAARHLGSFGALQAIPPLRNALKSADYRLSGEAMLALARLGDPRGQFLIGEILSRSDNPFVLVRGIQAMEAYGTASSIPLILDLLRNEGLPSHVADEAILALSDLMGMPRRFYHAYEGYVRDRKRANAILQDTLDEFFTLRKEENAFLRGVIADFIRDPDADGRLTRWVLDRGKGHTGVYAALLVSVALDANLNRQEYFRFFLCFWAASLFLDAGLIEK
jgi:MFS family permease